MKLDIIVEPDGGGFHAYCPMLKGLHVAGDTEKEALMHAGDALSAYMRSMIRHGDPLPHSRSEARRFQDTQVSGTVAREKAATHPHRFKQMYERSTPSCTVKIWECPCGVWSIRHFGCFNPNHDQNSLATLADLRTKLQQAEAKLEEGANLVFIGPSIPKREVDVLKAEHAGRCDEYEIKLQQAQGEVRKLSNWKVAYKNLQRVERQQIEDIAKRTAERDTAIERAEAAERGFKAKFEQVEALEGELAKQRVRAKKMADGLDIAEEMAEAGVTDYSSLGRNRVDCRFCNGVWRADGPANHGGNCPLVKWDKWKGLE